MKIKINKILELVNNSGFVYYGVDDFIADCKSYIKALKEGRLLFDVMSVSKSRMSRNIRIIACERLRRNSFDYRTYYTMLKTLGFKLNKDVEVKMSGCGTSMVFYLNYLIVNNLYNLGFLTKKERDILEQKIN